MMKNSFAEIDVNKLQLVTYGRISRGENYNFIAHFHPRIELMYVESGELEVTIYSQVVGAVISDTVVAQKVLPSNHFILLDSNVPHSLACSKETVFLTLEFINEETASIGTVVGFPMRQFFKDSPTLLSAMEHAGYYVCNDYMNLKDILGRIPSLFSSTQKLEFSDAYAEYKYLYRLYLQELFTTLCLNASKNQPRGIRFIRIINEYLSANFQRDFTLDELAEHIGINKFYMEKLYKQHTGKTIRQALTLLRLERAKMLLRTTTLSIKQIAKESGFNIRQQLIYNFKNYYNITPSEYVSSKSKPFYELETDERFVNETYKLMEAKGKL